MKAKNINLYSFLVVLIVMLAFANSCSLITGGDDCDESDNRYFTVPDSAKMYYTDGEVLTFASETDTIQYIVFDTTYIDSSESSECIWAKNYSEYIKYHFFVDSSKIDSSNELLIYANGYVHDVVAVWESMVVHFRLETKEISITSLKKEIILNDVMISISQIDEPKLYIHPFYGLLVLETDNKLYVLVNSSKYNEILEQDILKIK